MTLQERYTRLESEHRILHTKFLKAEHAVHELRLCLALVSSLKKSPRQQELISKHEYEYFSRVLSESKDADTLYQPVKYQ